MKRRDSPVEPTAPRPRSGSVEREIALESVRQSSTQQIADRVYSAAKPLMPIHESARSCKFFL
jgi:hypothetical protein